MRTSLLFIALAACSGGSPATSSTVPWPQRPPIDAAPDAALPRPIARGGSCGPANICAAGLSCFATPGGYCASPCGPFGGACDDGACATTVRDGDVCHATCERDADCRTEEGYFCDPQWHACAIPNTLAMVPKQCPGSARRDAAFVVSPVLDAPGAYQQEPTAILTSDGSLFVVASAPTEEVTQLIDTRVPATTNAPLAPGANDRSRVFVETAPELGPSTSLARDRKGVLYATWLDARRGPSVLFARSRDGGRTWSTPAPANDPADCEGVAPCLEQAFVVTGPDPTNKQRDVIYVGYVAGGALRVRASYDEGASFRAPVTALSAIRASATVDAAGRVHVIGVQGGPTGAYGSANHAIVYATSIDAGRTFTRATRLSQRDEELPFYGATPRIVVDDQRRWRYAVYVRGGRDAVWDLRVLASKDNGATWKRVRIGDDCAIHMTPQLALDPTTGALHLAWYDSRGAAGRFDHASCTPGLAKCSDPLPINDRVFAALSTARRSHTAVGDSAALVIDAKRRTLHAVWTQPVTEGTGVRARIFHAAAKLAPR